MSETIAQTLLIAGAGMAVTFAALGLVMLSMNLLTRFVRDPAPAKETQAQGIKSEPAPADLVLPAGTPLQQVAAAAVAVAAARELARQRHSAQVWLSPEPRSLISPWQLVARGRELDRSKKGK